MRAFIVHAWNNENASLFPPICDGIEYIHSTIRTIKKSFENSGITVNYDANTFRADDTIRRNFQKQIKDSQLIIVLLDGLRPNVVYEMGYAAALDNKKIICLCEKNATILVRNLYPDPLSVPCVNGSLQKILNPKLDIHTNLSDCSDLFILRYDRFNMEDLESQLQSYIDDFSLTSSKEQQIQQKVQSQSSQESENQDIPQENVSESSTICSNHSQEDSNNNKNITTQDKIYQRDYIWNLYLNGKDCEIQKIDNSKLDAYSKKTKALSYFRQKKFSDAIDAFKLLLEEKDAIRYSACYFLGVCYLMQNKYFEAFSFLLNAKIHNYKPKTSSIEELISLFADEIHFPDWDKIFSPHKDT